MRYAIDCGISQRGRRVKISEEVMNALGWSEGDHVVQLLDEKRRAVVIIRREDYDELRELLGD